MADERRNLICCAAMRISICLLFCAALCVTDVQAKFGADTTVCDLGAYAKRATQDTGPKKPTLPDQWTVRIEGNIIEHNYTQDIHEYYDGVDNKGAVVQYIGGVQTQMIFLYPTNELITLQFDNSGNPPRCHVDDLIKSTAKNVFGLLQWKNGTEHIFSANQALRFGGKIPEVYIGRAMARDGIIVDAWESCIYLDAIDGTFHLTWYFSANNTWASAINKVVPVQLSVDGIVHVNDSYSYNVLREYVFTDFRTVLFDGPVGAFDIPSGTFCPGLVSPRSPPNITASFSFSAEMVTTGSSFVDFIQEYYDKDHKLARFDYNSDPTEKDSTPLTRVHDYNTGVAYVLDLLSGGCTVSALDGSMIGSAETSNSHVRMKTAAELMYMDNIRRVYTGQRTVRGMWCDVYRAERDDYPPGASVHTVWEWSYASAEWMDDTGTLLMSNQLVMFHVFSADMSLDVIYNVFDYREEEQDVWRTDLTACFNYTQRQRLHITFPGSAKNNVTRDLNGFIRAVVSSVSRFAGITPLRVADVQVDYQSTDIEVTLFVLDTPSLPVKVKVTSPAVSLTDAVSKLNSLIKEGAFVVMLPDFVPLYANTSP